MTTVTWRFKLKKYQIILGAALLWASVSHADTISATVYFTDKNNQSAALGRVVFTDTHYGLLIQPQLSNLTPGLHGLHLHQHADCGDMGNHAGGHFDPQNTNSHQGPYGEGHLGDLPALYVDTNGKASLSTLAPRLRVSDLQGLTLMVHANGDNYSDNPPLGGGGSRMACGVISNAG